MSKEFKRLGASFRDPSGFLFTYQGGLYRQINQAYQADYEHLMASGLYDSLVKDGLLIPHEEADLPPCDPPTNYKVIRPEKIAFISYPYEWSFSQLKDAALVTLLIQRRALKFGMSLKDSSAYNIQFHQGKPVLLDTLSFERYEEGQPWVAYKQFCQHFLAPLALISYTDVRLSQLLRLNIDGIPLDLASKLLPRSTRIKPTLALHIHIHASAQRRYADKAVDPQASTRKMSQSSILGLIDSLKSGVEKLSWQPKGTEWADYYAEADHYTSDSIEHKKIIVGQYLENVRPKSVWDLGANAGMFSRIASDHDIPVIAYDIDPSAVEKNYLHVVAQKECLILPLVSDLTNPSPDIGWMNQERDSLMARGPADMIMALALIHHLAISNNVPLPLIASFFANMGKWLIIEFVPKTDSQVKLLLTSRKDIFTDYTQESFEHIFSERFEIRETVPVQQSERVLYLMKRRDPSAQT